MRKWTLGVILQKLSNCVCVFAGLCKWQMRLCTSKPCNVHPTSVLLWKRGRRDRERRGKRRAEHTGEFSPGNLFILWAKPVVLFFNTQKKQEVSKLNSSLMTVTAPFSATFPIPVKKMKVSVSELSRKLINTVNMSGGWWAMHPSMYCMDGGGGCPDENLCVKWCRSLRSQQRLESSGHVMPQSTHWQREHTPSSLPAKTVSRSVTLSLGNQVLIFFFFSFSNGVPKTEREMLFWGGMVITLASWSVWQSEKI